MKGIFENIESGQLYTMAALEDGRAIYYPQGGGFRHQMEIRAFMATHKLLEQFPSEWVRSRFHLDGGVKATGWHNPRALWNGWHMPHFDRETVAAIVNELDGLEFNPETMELFNLSEPEEWRENELIKSRGLYMFSGWIWSEIK